MFAKTIIDSDAFLDMPLSAQALYFHLSMRADDDGFINNPKKIQRMIGASDDDCKLLVMKRFIITFESGVIVIKHWRIHNYIQKDRYKPTIYAEEKALLDVKDNRAYTELKEECIHNVSNVSSLETQVRLGKNRIDKNNIYSDAFVEFSNGNDELLQSLKDFERMRKDLKKPLTERAKKMLLSALIKISENQAEQVEILNQSILHCWQTVYPLKAESKKESYDRNAGYEKSILEFMEEAEK